MDYLGAPQYFDQMAEAVGVEPITGYDQKVICCGGNAKQAGLDGQVIQPEKMARLCREVVGL
ncbi:MAG TPA: hypothetical protein VMW07_04110 [Gallionella sp.]|nr:hypothetical protein [Gallionella sp.]